MYRLLVADANEAIVRDLTTALGTQFDVMGCLNGANLPELIHNFRPDILIVDMTMSGLDLETVMGQIDTQKTKVIVTAVFCNDYIVRMLDSYGVCMLLLKPIFSHYLASKILRLRMDMAEQPDKELRGVIYEVLIHLGIRVCDNGFDQLAEAVVYACTHENFLIVKQLYPYVVSVCGGTVASVEKAISRCARQAYIYREGWGWARVFGKNFQKKCPSNRHFIVNIAYAVQKNPHLFK